MIKKRGNKWVVLDESGEKVLGTHDTEEKAKAQLASIEANKNKKSVMISFEDDDTMTIRDVEIFAVGTWRGQNSPPEGDKFTAEDLQSMVDAYNDKIIEQPFIKITHGPDKEQIDIGRVSNLRVIGKKLVGDFIEVPKGLYELMKRGLFSRRSAEVIWNLKDKAGKVFSRVLKAVALLAPGQIPAVSALAEGYKFEKFSMYEFREEDESDDSPWTEFMGEAKAITVELDGETVTYINDHGSWVKKANTNQEDEKMNELIKKLMKIFGVDVEDKLESAVIERIKKGDKAIEQLKEYEEKIKADREKDVKDFIVKMKDEGKILPKEEEGITQNFESLLKAEDAEGIKNLKSFISGLEKRVDLGEHSKKGDDAKNYDQSKKPADEVDRLANEFIKDGKAKDYSEAIGLVQKSYPDLWTAYNAKSEK